LHYNSETQVLLMPTEIHECHVRWLVAEFSLMLVSNWFTAPEFFQLDVHKCNVYSVFQPPYAASSKMGDWICRLNTNNLPRVLVEAGWRIRDNVSRPSTPQVKSILWQHTFEGGRFWMEGKRRIHIVIYLYYI
ncbi:hypothetical protein V8E54_013349, partial [Elaphomyces granulatus]